MSLRFLILYRVPYTMPMLEMAVKNTTVSFAGLRIPNFAGLRCNLATRLFGVFFVILCCGGHVAAACETFLFLRYVIIFRCRQSISRNDLIEPLQLFYHSPRLGNTGVARSCSLLRTSWERLFRLTGDPAQWIVRGVLLAHASCFAGSICRWRCVRFSR